MDTISRVRIPAFVGLLILCSIPLFGQNYKKAQWGRVRMDSTYDYSQGKAAKVIDRHKATSPSLLEPVGKSSVKLKSDQLSGFVTDVLLGYAAQSLARAGKNPEVKADLSIFYFKNNKVCLPEGDITPRDILSLFSMDSKVITLSLKGQYLQELINDSAKKGAVLSQFEEAIDNNRMYKIVTIDYSFKKENSAKILEYAEQIKDCNTSLSNVLIQYIKKLTRKGEMIK